jgi:tetratricopeptide (TPR) repeat protein
MSDYQTGEFMKTIITTVCLLLSLNFVTCANADSQSSTGNQSPVIKAGRDVIINYSSKEEIDKIVAIYAQQHKLDTEQIKSLTAAVTALSQGKDVIGTESQIQAAMAALAQGNTAQAKALFEKETQRVELAAKQGAEAYRNLGALAFLDNTQEALQAYRRATELDPDNADSWNELGHLFRRVGELDQAIAAYQTVLRLGDQQKIGLVYVSLGNAYRTRGEWEKAINFYNEALKEGGIDESINVYGNLGIVYQNRGELYKAIDMYNKALTISQERHIKIGMAINYESLGNVYRILGKLNQAFEMQRKALAISESLNDNIGLSEDYSNLGRLYYTSGDFNKAIDFYKKSLDIKEKLEMKEGLADTYTDLGLVYEKKGNKTEAKRYYQKSIELYKYIGRPEWKNVQSSLDKL